MLSKLNLPRSESIALGDKPFMLLPHSGATGIVGLVGGFVGFAYLGPAGAGLVALWAANNIFYMEKTAKAQLPILAVQPAPTPELPPAPTGPDDYTQTVDVPSVFPALDPWVEPVSEYGKQPVVPPVTRGSAIPVAFTPVAEYVEQVPVVAGPTVATLAVPKTALEKILQSPYQSRIFFGAQRSGKSMLVAIGSQDLVKRGAKVYHINLLSYAKDGVHDEDAQYTRHCFKSVRGDISKLGHAQVANLIGDAIAAVHAWWDEQNALLIIDEWAYTAAKFGQYADLLKEFVTLVSGKISTLTSSGMQRTLAIWAIAPEMRAGNMLECGGKSIKGMNLTYVTVPPGKVVEWQGQAVGFDDQLFDQVGYNFSIKYPTMADAAGQDRIAFIGDRWLPLGTSPDMLMQPLLEPKQLPMAVELVPSSVSPVLDEFSVDDLALPIPPVVVSSTEFVDNTVIPALERTMKTDPQYEMFVDVLNWLRGQELVTLTGASQAGWSKKAQKNGWIPDRKAETMATALGQLTGPKYRLLTPEPDGRSYRVTLR